MSVIERLLSNIPETLRMAAWLAGQVRPGDVAALSGEVGSGKTTFAQAFIGALSASPKRVTSPTFTLVQSHDTRHSWQVVHADLYRLKNAGELEELGLEEAFAQHVTLIEWPEIAHRILPDHTLHIGLSYVSDDSRKITLTSHSQRWQNVLQQVV